MASTEVAGAGSSNVLQVDGSNENDQNNESFHSAHTAASASTTTTNISATSESNLHVPGKLLSDIIKLKQCYVNIIKVIDPHSSPSTSPEDNIAPFLNKDQMTAGLKKVNAPGCRTHLAEILDCVRPICLPAYRCYDPISSSQVKCRNIAFFNL